jgi:hypothetical protein
MRHHRHPPDDELNSRLGELMEKSLKSAGSGDGSRDGASARRCSSHRSVRSSAGVAQEGDVDLGKGSPGAGQPLHAIAKTASARLRLQDEPEFLSPREPRPRAAGPYEVLGSSRRRNGRSGALATPGSGESRSKSFPMSSREVPRRSRLSTGPASLIITSDAAPTTFWITKAVPFVMEVVEGEDLAERLSWPPPSEVCPRLRASHCQRSRRRAQGISPD